MPLYRRLEKNAQLMEYKCVEFAEELMYGHLVKRAVSARCNHETRRLKQCNRICFASSSLVVAFLNP